MDMGLKDKVVLITGGGGGIARGIERAFATEGAKFILTDCSPAVWKRQRRSLSAISAPKCSRFSRTDRWKRRCVRRRSGRDTSAGAIDVLINNAQASRRD